MHKFWIHVFIFMCSNIFYVKCDRFGVDTIVFRNNRGLCINLFVVLIVFNELPVPNKDDNNNHNTMEILS